jgi:hypothetical protein
MLPKNKLGVIPNVTNNLVIALVYQYEIQYRIFYAIH